MARAGRKRKQAARHPSGQVKKPSPNEAKEAAQHVALSARRRLFGLSAEDAPKQEAESLVGRLVLMGMLDDWHWKAALQYEEIVRAADRCYLAKGYPSPGDLNRSGGYDGSDGTEPGYVAACTSAILSANRCHRALRDSGIETDDAFVRGAVDMLVFEGAYNHRFLGSARIGLNALARLLHIPMVRKLRKQDKAA